MGRLHLVGSEDKQSWSEEKKMIQKQGCVLCRFLGASVREMMGERIGNGRLQRYEDGIR